MKIGKSLFDILIRLDFLIRSLNSIERADLLKLALKEIHDSNCKVYSINLSLILLIQ